jgi:NAD/NADP transhydrogenase alpha subunit
MPEKKVEKPVKIGIKVPGKPAREVHTIKKNKKGEVIVDHAGNKGKYDKINLTKKAGAKTIAQGVKATKDWHKKNG